MKKLLVFIIGFFYLQLALAANFSTDGNGIRNIVAATIANQNVLYISELDGSIGAYKSDGTKLWRNATTTENGTKSAALLFELAVYDLDGDGNDDLLAAGADGYIYAWNSDGILTWAWQPTGAKVRFSDLAVTKVNNAIRIFAGGNNSTLYELDENGDLVNSIIIPGSGVTRKIAVGNFLDANQTLLYVHTYAHDKFGGAYRGFYNPATKEFIRNLKDHNIDDITNFYNLMATDFDVADITGDGKDDLLFFGAGKSTGDFFALDGDANLVARFEIQSSDKQRYAHVNGVVLPGKDEIFMQYGSKLYRLDLTLLKDLTDNFDGIKEETGSRYTGLVYQDVTLLKTGSLLYAAGSVGGGNDLDEFNINQSNWLTTSHSEQGRLKEVADNMQTLYQQAKLYTPPSYQKKPTKTWQMLSSVQPSVEVQQLSGADLLTIEQETLYEYLDADASRTALLDDIKAFARRKGATEEEVSALTLPKEQRANNKNTKTQAELIAWAAAKEASNTPFSLWVGHGNDPFYIQLDTLKTILNVAPNTCYGFIYAEMHNPSDRRYQYFAEEYVPELVAAIRNTETRHAKMYFRYKNIFWGGSAHVYPWKEMFFSGKYADVLVPASEDTTSRTQDINLAGRVGMLASGLVDDFAMRLVDDNPTSWRPYSAGGQSSVSPYLRQGVMMAAYGARLGILFNNQFISGEGKPGLDLLYALMKSGVLPLVNREDILSIGSWHLTQTVDEHHLDVIENHHNMKNYTEGDENAVLSLAEIHWAGTNLPAHDLSKILYGVDYRWLNYMPPLPYGMVPIIPTEHEPEQNLKAAQKATLTAQGVPFSVSTLKNGIADDGVSLIEGNLFGNKLTSTAQAGAAKLPVVVSGAAWSAIQLDDTHIRIILIDQGYVDPQERTATITLQNIMVVSAKNMLTGENLAINAQQLQTTVPAGSIAVIDLTLSTPYLGNSDSDGDIRLAKFDNCPDVSNTDQINSDDDALGNACDLDDDNDNISDADEILAKTDPLKADTDNDGVNDDIDAFPLDPSETIDSDNDTIGDNADNCPLIKNTDQLNGDQDQFGDACDDDTIVVNDEDNDGIADEYDNCPTVHNPDQYIYDCEVNIAPRAQIQIFQQGKRVAIIDPDGGNVVVKAVISDANQGDSHTVKWQQLSPNDFIKNDTNNDVDFIFSPSTYAGKQYPLTVLVTDLGGLEYMLTTQLHILSASAQLSNNLDTDNDGTTDANEGLSDSDSDGIADFLDDDLNTAQLPIVDTNAHLKTTSNLQLSVGDTIKSILQENVASTGMELSRAANLSTDINLTAATNSNQYYAVSPLLDFVISGLTAPGDSAAVLIELASGQTLPSNAVYRKYNSTKGWYNFNDDENNQLFSAALVNNTCPELTSSNYRRGLNQGDACVKVVLVDGGDYDSDGEENGQIADPGVIMAAVPQLSIAVNQSQLTLTEGQTTTLIATLTNGDGADIIWTETGGKQLLTLTGLYTNTVTITAADVDETTTTTFYVEATLDEQTVSQTINITVNKAAVPSPVAKSGGSLSWYWLLLILLIIAGRKRYI